MNRMSKDQAQKFLDAAERYFELVELYGQDDDRVIAAFTQVIVLFLRSCGASFEKKARELGLLPDPVGYSDDDKPVFSLQDVARAHDPRRGAKDLRKAAPRTA